MMTRPAEEEACLASIEDRTDVTADDNGKMVSAGKRQRGWIFLLCMGPVKYCMQIENTLRVFTGTTNHKHKPSMRNRRDAITVLVLNTKPSVVQMTESGMFALIVFIMIHLSQIQRLDRELRTRTNICHCGMISVWDLTVCVSKHGSYNGKSFNHSVL